MVKIAWRKSWSYENIYGRKGDSNGSKRRLSPISRSIWDDYLDLAELSPVKGKICAAKDLGYSQDFLAKLLKIDPIYIDLAEKEMLKMRMIYINPKTRVISISHWKHYQSEYDRQRPYREKLQQEVTGKSYKEGNKADTDIDKEKIAYAGKHGFPYPQPTKEEKEQLTKLHNVIMPKVNIYKFMGKLAKKKGYPPPIMVMIKVCQSYIENKSKVKDPWAWLRVAVEEESKKYFAELNIQESEINKNLPLRIGNIIKGA